MDPSEIRQRIGRRSWYHKMELAPGIETPGAYAPGPLLETIGFPEDLTGKTVLDIGARDGFFSFEAERRGAARVLACDLNPAEDMGFATAREILGSKVEFTVCSVYDLDPERHGCFDVVLFLGVFYHLRHPLLALDRIHALCREWLLIESHVLDQQFIQDGEITPLAEISPRLPGSNILQFYPSDELAADSTNWFAPTTACMEQMVRTSGFVPQRTSEFHDRAAVLARWKPFTRPAWY